MKNRKIKFKSILLFLLFFSYIYIIEKDKQLKLINKINEYILICKNGTLINNLSNNRNIVMVTVILPLHNSEKTIKTSVRSIQNQNFYDFEIILIDDYSKDKSYKIIKLLQKEDNRIKIIKNKKNRGALYSKSIAALKAKGKYIFSLDSDDLFVNENLFNFCYKESEKYNIDILEFSGLICRNGTIIINERFPEIPLYLRFKKNNLIVKAPNLKNFIYKKVKNHYLLIDGYLWGKSIKTFIYKKALNIIGEQIYTKNVCYCDDRIVNFFLFKVANSFKFVNLYGIIYNINIYSTVHSQKPIIKCHDELVNIMTLYNYTKNNQEVQIVVYEIIYRWKIILFPGLKNINNKKNLLSLINQMLKNKNINIKDKNILKQYYKQIL